MEEPKPRKKFWSLNQNSRIVKYGLAILAGIYAIVGIVQYVND